MNILITILIIVAGIIALLIVVALFSKKEYLASREIIINAPIAKVFDYLKNIKNQDNYNKWVMMDPAMNREFKGIDGTVGFKYAWNGNKKAGEGEQEITVVIDNKKIETEIRFVRPMKSVANARYITEVIMDNQTKVIWSNGGKVPVPMNIMASKIENMLGKDMDVTLNNLKTILEK